MVKIAQQRSLIDNWDFALFGQSNDRNIPKFQGYVSSIDPTTAGTGVLIGGSQNTYKSILGTVKNRAGMKLRGPADQTDAGVVSSFEWETSLGDTRVLRAVNGKLQVEFDDGSGTLQYIDLLTGLTQAEMNFSFAPWFSDTLSKDELIFVNGEQKINMWTGGIGSVTSSTIDKIVLNDSAPTLGFSNSGSILVGGVTYTYTGAGSLENQIYTHTSTDATPDLSNATRHAQMFTTSAAGTGILRVTARVKSLAISSTSATMTGYIYTDNAGVPGTLIASTTTKIVGAFSPGDFDITFSFTNVSASPLTNYHFVLAHTSGGGTFDAYIGSTGGVGTNISINTGTTWSAENGYLYLSIYENTITANTLTGVTPDASGITPGALAIQTVLTSTNTASGNSFSSVFGLSFTNDWIAVIGNQLYVGCYTERSIFISDIEDYSSFGPIGSVRSPGDPDLLILDSNSRGATSKTGQKGNAVIFGSLGDSYSLVRNQANFITSTGGTTFIFETVIVDKSTSSDLSSPQGQNFIDSIGDTIIFLDQNNQLRQFGTLRNLVTPVFPILSLDIYTELSALDFTGGSIRAVAEQSGETVYMTCPLSGLTYVYQVREKPDLVGNLTAERLWQPPQVWNISRIAVIAGVTYGYSASNPQMFQLWDTGQFYDDSPDGATQLPYESHAIWAYQSLGSRVQQLFFDKVYFEGYMTRGTPLYCNVYKDYQGAKGIQMLVVNNPETPPAIKRARFYGSNGSPEMGSISLGQIPLGQGVGGIATDFPKFRAIRNASAEGIFEYSLDAFSVDVGAQWEMLVLGANMQVSPGRSAQLLRTNL